MKPLQCSVEHLRRAYLPEDTDKYLVFIGNVDEPESAFETCTSDLLPAMRECVEQLPPRSRELLQRRYADNENATALARGLRMNADAVRQQLLRIRLAVKECVERKVVGLWS